jgi:glycosyltransferase involved in cell wall biosynthesis
MRILMISPHPTYSPRGTPISVLNRCRALCALGHEIDLVTYGIGTDVPVAGLTYLRAPVPGIRRVKVGPSVSKVPLDLAVFIKATIRAIRGRRRYDVIHSHEEAGIVGAIVSRMVGLPHVYDMGNDLSVVMANYGYSPRHVLTRVAVATENATVRGSDSVIAHFLSIADRVGGIADGRIPATVVANVPIEAPAMPALASRLRSTWSPDALPIVLYTGTLEKYQGVPALLEAVGLLQDRGVKCRLIVVGGSIEQQDELRLQASELAVQDTVSIVGATSQDEIRSCLEAADILVSPRAGGSNTPLKLFSYMHSGKPLLATSIPGHLQILDDESACLVEPTAAGLAQGLLEILQNPGLAADRAMAAQQLAMRSYDITQYIADVAEAYLPVGGQPVSAPQLDRASGIVQGDLVRAAG